MKISGFTNNNNMLAFRGDLIKFDPSKKRRRTDKICSDCQDNNTRNIVFERQRRDEQTDEYLLVGQFKQYLKLKDQNAVDTALFALNKACKETKIKYPNTSALNAEKLNDITDDLTQQLKTRKEMVLPENSPENFFINSFVSHLNSNTKFLSHIFDNKETKVKTANIFAGLTLQYENINLENLEYATKTNAVSPFISLGNLKNSPEYRFIDALEEHFVNAGRYDTARKSIMEDIITSLNKTKKQHPDVLNLRSDKIITHATTAVEKLDEGQTTLVIPSYPAEATFIYTFANTIKGQNCPEKELGEDKADILEFISSYFSPKTGEMSDSINLNIIKLRESAQQKKDKLL